MGTIIQWGHIFETGEIPPGTTENEALIAGLNAWGNILSGHKPPENFGKAMVAIGDRLGVKDSTHEGLMRLAKKRKP